MTSLVTLTKSTGWYGTHSGYYEQLPKYFETCIRQCVIEPKPIWVNRMLGKLVSVRRGYAPRNQSITWAEFCFERKTKRLPNSHGLILAAENHLPLISRLERNPRVTATIHFPPSHWNLEMQRALKGLDSAIVLYRRHMPFFESLVGRERVKFVRHGVDLDFFRPDYEARKCNSIFRILVVGQFDRDFVSIARCVKVLQDRGLRFQLDIVAVAIFAEKIDGFKCLLKLPNCKVHSGISDDSLRSLYQKANCILIPFIDSGANNAIVEALACGTPIVTNDIGGIRDYGGGDIFPIAETFDDLVDLTSKYLTEDDTVHEITTRSRRFVEANLSWEKIARDHIDAIESLTGGLWSSRQDK